MEIKDFGEVVFEFPMLYSGWECDEKGYVVRTPKGHLDLILSDHGRLYSAPLRDLEDKISEYEEAIKNSRTALAMIYDHPTEDYKGEWWRDQSTIICNLEYGQGVTSLHASKRGEEYEYAIVWWHFKSPNLQLLVRGGHVVKNQLP